MAARQNRSPNDSRPVNTVPFLAVVAGVVAVQIAIFGAFAAFVFPPDLL